MGARKYESYVSREVQDDTIMRRGLKRNCENNYRFRVRASVRDTRNEEMEGAKEAETKKRRIRGTRAGG